ncbi:Uncharacterized protein FWK35_00034111 [Aphis craccivora]|uniref:Uncharacterized protein n=1 Tax=Aphis craccivora TaxID=307492 RepID=A0A6G0Z6F2_APHCR|nr:Uncharacterized protein FWK35_00034111 [Aphis craccivora]
MKGDDLVKPARVAGGPIKVYQEIFFIPGDRDPYRSIHCLWRHTKYITWRIALHCHNYVTILRDQII